jgi:hypothetical protein
VIAVALLWALLQPFLSVTLFFTGDEPNYLISTVSFLRDGDFNLVNNFREQHAREFGGEYATRDLKPQWYPHLDFPVIPAEHGTAFPIAIAPAYALGGVTGVRWFLIALAGGACLLVGFATDSLTGARWAGSVAALLLATTPAWQMSASRVYPDALAGFLVSAALCALTRSPANLPHFVAGLSIGLLPLLAVKYAAIAVPIAAATLVIASRSLGLYSGYAAAIALSLANIAFFHDQGALGGNFLATQPHIFGFPEFGRYWKQWFDSHHGIFVYQPYTILALWAVIFAIRRVRPAAALRREQPREILLAGLALAVLGYTGIHAFWLSSPGWSAPGRYLAALLPVICVLVVCWAAQNDTYRRLRLSLLAASAVFSLAFLLEAMRRKVQPDFAFRQWSDMFPAYWESWHTYPTPVTAQVGAGPYLLILFIAATKAAAFYRAKAKALSGT